MANISVDAQLLESVVSGTNENDIIVFDGLAEVNTINASAGNDSIYFKNDAADNIIDAGAGNDTVAFDGLAEVNTINAGDGDDSIYFDIYAAGNIIDAGAGNDTIHFDYDAIENTINAGDGDDSIYFNGDPQNNIINAGAGNDTIVFNEFADLNTIDGGDGSDLIVFNGAASENVIINFGAGDSIQLPSKAVEYSDEESLIYSEGSIDGSDFVIYAKLFSNDNDQEALYEVEAVRIVGVGSNIKSLGSGIFVYQESIGNYFSIDGSRATQIENGTIATEYGDTIYAENLSTSIDARGGDDIISVISGSGVINGGSGADRIYLGSGADVTIVGEGIVSQDGSIWTIGEDSIYGVGSNYSITSAGDNLFKIVAIDGETSELGLMVGSNEIEVDESGIVSIESDAVISVDSATKSATLVVNESNQDYNLTFYHGALVEKWNATLSGGNDTIQIEDIKGGNFDGGDGKDYFNISKNLQGNVTLTGGATNDNLESGNSFYAESSSVSSSSSQNKITITDVNFNASDVILIDAGVENLTSEFFGDSRFYNYSSASDASTSGVYAGTVFDASDLVSSLGMSHSMLRMADKSRVTLDDENSIDENLITNVIWANSNSATIDFSQSQTENVLIFTNTNSRGDLVSLGGDFDDTIHAGASDTIDAGGGDDLIYLNRRNHVVFGSSEGNDTIYGWDSTDTLDISSIPDVSISSDGLYLENNNGTLLIEGSFTNSTNIKYSNGIMRVADSNGEVIYNKNVTYYAGSTLIMNSSSNNTIDLSSSTYENISVIDTSNASGRDTFRYTSEAGDVTISNGDSKDVVDLSSYSIDEISTQFTDSGLILTINDSNLNIVGTNLTTFSLASGKYTADFQNQTLS